MNPKTLLVFLSGLLVGGGALYFIPRHAEPSGEMKQQLAKLASELDQSRAEVTQLQAKVKETAAPEADPEVAEREKTEAVKHAEQRTAQQKARMEKLKQKVEDRLKIKVEEQLALLKKKLGLTDAQGESVRELLLDSLRKNDFALKVMRAQSETPQEGGYDAEKEMMETLLNPQKKEQELDAKLLGLFSPAQQAAYAAHQQEQRTNNVEMAANKELAKLQGAMSLSGEQKDQLFSTLTAFANQEHDQPIPVMIARIEKQPGELERIKKESGEETANQMLGMVEELKQRQAKRRDALKPILSEEQLKVYENLQQMSAFDMGDLMDQMGMSAEMMMMNNESKTEEPTPSDGN